ncbi:MAG: sugar transferase, partial [Promethearchaeota archaeon]
PFNINDIIPSILFLTLIILSALILFIDSILLFLISKKLNKYNLIISNKIFQLIIKRLLDILISIIILILFAPIFFIISLIIKLSSKGPVFIIQERVGLGQRDILIYKFRTFDLSSLNNINKAKLISEKDLKLTLIGKFLKSYNINEFPQILSVLKGDMSLIGPRPMFPYEVKYLTEDIKRIRFQVLPGITGLWQISDKENLTFENMIKLDREYIENWNIFLDIKIFFKTLKRGFSSN